jgi:hypothetical protein
MYLCFYVRNHKCEIHVTHVHTELFTDIIRLLPHILSYFPSLSFPINLLKRLSHRFIFSICVRVLEILVLNECKWRLLLVKTVGW